MRRVRESLTYVARAALDLPSVADETMARGINLRLGFARRASGVTHAATYTRITECCDVAMIVGLLCAMSNEMSASLVHRVVEETGRGRSFCSGVDANAR